MKKTKNPRIGLVTILVIPWVILISILAIFPALTLKGQEVMPAGNIWKRGIYVSAFAAIDGRREINIGYERGLNNLTYLDMGIGFRYLYSSDPMLIPFESEEFQGFTKKNCYSSYTFWIIPTGGTCDDLFAPIYYKDATDYLSFDMSTKIKMKHFLDVDKGFGYPYIKWGLQVGYRSYIQYKETNGTLYKDMRILSSYVVGNDAEGTRYYTYEAKVYRYEKLTKEKISVPYVMPEIGLGCRIKIAKKLTTEIGGTLYLGHKYKNHSLKSGVHVNGDILLTYWL